MSIHLLHGGFTTGRGFNFYAVVYIILGALTCCQKYCIGFNEIQSCPMILRNLGRLYDKLRLKYHCNLSDTQLTGDLINIGRPGP